MTKQVADLEQAQAQGIAPWQQPVDDLSDFHVTVFRDRYPVTAGHLLFVPNYNTDHIVYQALQSAFLHGQRMVAQGQWEAFNVGLNHGRAAGQTVMYPHVHLIPRRQGDCLDPTGGVRGVINTQQNYKSSSYHNPE